MITKQKSSQMPKSIYLFMAGILLFVSIFSWAKQIHQMPSAEQCLRRRLGPKTDALKRIILPVKFVAKKKKKKVKTYDAFSTSAQEEDEAQENAEEDEDEHVGKSMLEMGVGESLCYLLSGMFRADRRCSFIPILCWGSFVTLGVVVGGVVGDCAGASIAAFTFLAYFSIQLTISAAVAKNHDISLYGHSMHWSTFGIATIGTSIAGIWSGCDGVDGTITTSFIVYGIMSVVIFWYIAFRVFKADSCNKTSKWGVFTVALLGGAAAGCSLFYGFTVAEATAGAAAGTAVDTTAVPGLLTAGMILGIAAGAALVGFLIAKCIGKFGCKGKC